MAILQSTERLSDVCLEIRQEEPVSYTCCVNLCIQTVFLYLRFPFHPGGGGGGGGGGGDCLWPLRKCAAGQGMVFVLSVLNRVYNFVRVCPKHGEGIQFRTSLS